VKTALLLMDLQRGIVDRVREPEPLLDSAARALDGARAAGIAVVHVRMEFRPGYPEISRRNKFFHGVLIPHRSAIVGEPGTEIHPAVAPREGEPVTTKLRVSAFTGSELEVILRALEIERLVLSGIATSGVVLSTVRDAADRDFELTVLADACADTSDDDVHRVLMEQLFPRQADVVTVDEWLGSLSTSAG
jgi:nicotinamidase-related amidase